MARPDTGTARVFGQPPQTACAGGWAGGWVGAMLQSGGLPTEITVNELVVLVRSLYPKALRRSPRLAERRDWL